MWQTIEKTWQAIEKTWHDVAKWRLFRLAGHFVRLDDLLGALLLFVLGIVIGRLVGRWVYRRLSRFESISGASADHIGRWVRLLVMLGFLIPALRVLGVPMTAFSFLGGAIALGFGFGAQTLCSNIISGIILLATRPYRPGDVVEVDGQIGTVHLVGLRATEVVTLDGVQLLVPNSVFLQNIVVNRSPRDRVLRGSAAVSVAYDTDTRAVSELLRQVASAHPAVLKEEDKAPWVLFEDFQDSGLLFRVFFWVDITQQGVPATASDIRHEIMAALRKAGFSIPYPHLDVAMRPPVAVDGQKP